MISPVTACKERYQAYGSGGRFCKYHTSNDVFPRCKTCAQKTTGKSYDELLQHDNKLRN